MEHRTKHGARILVPLLNLSSFYPKKINIINILYNTFQVAVESEAEYEEENGTVFWLTERPGIKDGDEG